MREITAKFLNLSL